MHRFSLPNIKACIFDLDGTLLDSMNVWQEVDRQYLQRFGYEFNPRISEEIKSLSFNESAKYFKQHFDIPRSESEMMSDWDAMVEEEYKHHIPLKEGARELLEKLYESKIPMCIATSCNKKHALMALQRLNIDHYFEFVLTCKDVGKNKNFPDVFETCATKLNQEHKDILVFEDLLVAIQVASNAGFQTCGVLDAMSASQFDLLKKHSDSTVEKFTHLK